MAVVMEEAAKLRGVLKNEPISVRCICVCVNISTLGMYSLFICHICTCMSLYTYK